MRHKIYALYKGEELLADGTLSEIAKRWAFKNCPFYADPCIFIECEDGQEAYPPNLWDIERLEREGK